MARLGVDYETIKQTAVKLLSQGVAPSVQKIRETLGTGSNTTIAEHLKVWRDEYAKKAIHHLPANMPKELISTFEVLWQTAMEQAQNQLVEYKQAIENDREMALQREQAANKSVVDIKQKMDDISTMLEQEISAKQKLNIELAITNERLIKKDEVITAQKNQYEDRLKRIYEEKDVIVMQCHQLQSDVKLGQEKISLQTEQYQKSIAQHNASHEQSENRWAMLIDQSRSETKDAFKKLENTHIANDIESKKLKATISELQQAFYEKSAQLNVSVEKISQLKQDIKMLESELIKARSIIMQFEEKQKIEKREAILKSKIKIASK